MSPSNVIPGTRVKLRLHGDGLLYRELRPFVRACIEPMERELGRFSSWEITIVRERVSFRCDVAVRSGDAIIVSNGNGFDAAVAGREAFRHIEDELRTHTSQVAS